MDYAAGPVTGLILIGAVLYYSPFIIGALLNKRNQKKED